MTRTGTANSEAPAGGAATRRQAGSILVVLLALLACPSLAVAEADLSSNQVDRFLDSLPDVEALGEKYGRQEPQQRIPDPEALRRRMPHGAAGIAGLAESGGFAIPKAAPIERATSPFASHIDVMRASEGWNEMVSTVEKHGFASVAEWASVGDRAMRAFAASQMDREMPKMDAEMAKMRKRLTESGMPEAQQEAMLELMNSSQRAMQTVQDVPEADKRAVAPHLDRFRALGRSFSR